jgi:RHS repeat-associated protein
MVATPSVIKGQEHQIRYSRNPFGQITQMIETGFSPLFDDKTNSPQELKRTTSYTYQTINGKSVLVAIADPLGNTTKYQWDDKANTITQVTYPMGLTASMVYDTAGFNPNTPNNPTGRMVQTTGIDGQVTQVSYTAQGDIASWSRAGRSVTTTQDNQGRTVLWKSNDGQSIQANYDERDKQGQRQIRYTLPDGQSLVSSLSSESQTTSVGWQGSDQQSIVAPNQTTYSPTTGLPVEITAPTGLKTTLGYDQANQLTSIQRGRQSISKTTEYTSKDGFDPLNQLTKLDVSGAKYTLGTKAAENSLTLPTEASYTSTVDDFGRTVIMQSPHINSGTENGKDNGRSLASYDLNDRLIQLKDSLRTSSASFDALGRLVQRRHSINKDASGTVISTATVTTTSDPKDNNKDDIFTYTYEGARLKSITGTAQTTTYSYTPQGQVAQEQVTLQNNATTTSFTTNHSYDSFGRLSQTQLPEGATLSHHYSAISRLERVDYQPAAQAGWRGWWTQLARLAVPDYGTQALVTNIQTDSAHGLLGYQASNGQTVQATFDTAGRLKSWRDGPVSTSLGFNQNDELASLEKQKPAHLDAKTQNQTIAESQTLQYNIMGQLSDVKTIKAGNAATQALEAYSYDQNGNRLQTKQEGQQAGQNSYPQSYSYKPASDQLQSIQTGAAKSNYSYNSHGEPVQISTAQGDKTQTRDLSYGARGELLAIADQGKPTASYQYNHALQRVSKTVSNQTTNYLWHGGMIDAEIQNGQITKRYIFINLRAVAVIEYENDENGNKNNSTSGSKYAGYKPKSTAIYAIHTDHLGTPQAITDDKQAVVWRADYATFGRATVQARVADGSSRTAKTSFGIISTANAATTTAKPFEFNLRFAGQYEDTESGYHYNWHRYYDPSTGRYLTPDPIGLAGGLNGYGYAGQDPMASVDPTGLNCTTIGNNVTCDSPYLNGPHITFPKPPYSPDMVWPDSIDPSNSWYHKYDKQPSISTGTCTSKELMQGVIKKPTPGIFSQPASVQGTPNFATPTPLDILTLPIGSINPVISYIIKDNNNPNISWVVNVTQPGHALFPGYVARGVVNTATGVEMHTYGEGVGFLQSPEAPSRVSNTINNAWIGLSNDVITNAKCGCSK